MPRSVVELLGEDAIERIRLPVSQAGGLPRQAYTSQEFFELERERLFPRVWVGVGFTSDVAEPGDAVPLLVAGLPIILCRGKDGQIRAFHNVCRHRAAMVLEKPAKGLNVLRCPYHAWAWDLQGSLKAMPYFDGTPDSRDCGLDWGANGLVPIRTGVWYHWVFVNLDGSAPPLEDYLAPMNDAHRWVRPQRDTAAPAARLGIQRQLEIPERQLGNLSPCLGARGNLHPHVGRPGFHDA